MATTLSTSKAILVEQAHAQMRNLACGTHWTPRQKLALTCRILFDAGHDSGLAGQITCRAQPAGSFYTQQLGLGFDEICESNLIQVNEDLQLIAGYGMPNPANRFHTWIYRHREDVNCIIHAHSPHVSALSMLEQPLIVSHMDTCPLHEDCAFLPKWPGIPVGNEEGEIIMRALGTRHALILAHHGYLVAAQTIEQACILALLIERAAKMQLLAMSAGDVQPIPNDLAQEAREWMTTEKRYALAFSYYARRALRNKSNVGCLEW
jgi:L-fuculose-phosphate aldolase